MVIQPRKGTGSEGVDEQKDGLLKGTPPLSPVQSEVRSIGRTGLPDTLLPRARGWRYLLGRASRNESFTVKDLSWAALVASAAILVLSFLLSLPPQKLGGLWTAIGTIRSATTSAQNELSVLLVGSAVAVALFWWARKGQNSVRPALFLVGVALAFAGEIFLLQQSNAVGAVLFVAGGTASIAQHFLGHDRTGEALESVAWSWRKEGFLLVLVLTSAFFTHLYQLGRIPYGIEGDESSWALRVVNAMNRSEPGLPYPFAQMPTSYWLQTASYTLFGTSIESARLGVALLSLAGTVLFYFAVREMVNAPVALIATYLLGISLIDMAASRQAHVETYVKIWIMAAVFCMIWGYKKFKPWLFAIAGTSLAFGLMVYDSFALTPFGLLAYAVFRLLRDRPNWKQHVAFIGALVLPIVVVAPGVWTYLEGRRISQVATLAYETGFYPDSPAKIAAFLPTLLSFAGKYAGVTLERLMVQQLNDVLIGRPGPLESAALMPFLFLGLVLTVLYCRQRSVTFALFWVLVPGLPTSLILGQAFARTLYPFLGGLVVFAAIAMWVAYRTLHEELTGRLRFGLTVVFVSYLGLLGLSNGYVYFNEVSDPSERQMRREFGDLLGHHIGDSQMVYLPYLPVREDFLEYEWRYAQYVISARFPHHAPDEYYQSIPYPELLKSVESNRLRYPTITIFYDKTILEPAERQSILQALKRCYPNYRVQVGGHFEAYTFSSNSLTQSTCYHVPDLNLLSPAMDQTIAADHGANFKWQTRQGITTGFKLELDRHNDQVVWLEAEDFRGIGWEAGKDLVGDYSGSAYLVDVGVADDNRAELAIEVPQAGKYEIWLRSYRRRSDGSPVYLDVASRRLEFGSSATAGWYWESLGWRDLLAGNQTITITRRYDPAAPWQIMIDAVVLSRQAGFDPNLRVDWEKVLETSIIESTQNEYRYGQPLADGNYRWRVEVFDGDRLIGWDGTPGFVSSYGRFTVRRAAINSN